MPMIKESDQQAIKERFSAVTTPVSMVLFTRKSEPPEHAGEMATVLQELADLAETLTLEIFDFEMDSAMAEKYGVERMPAIVLVGEKDYGVRYYGFPFGHEFPAFIDDIIDVSKGESGLSPETRERLTKLPTPVHLRVISTPT